MVLWHNTRIRMVTWSTILLALTAVHVTCGQMPLTADDQVLSIVDFGFLKGGELRVQIGGVAVGEKDDASNTSATIPEDVGLEPKTEYPMQQNLQLEDMRRLLIFLVTASSWKKFEEIIYSKQLRKNYCTSLPLLKYEYFNSFDELTGEGIELKELALPLSSRSPGLKLIMATEDDYELYVINCVGERVAFSINVTAKNFLPDGSPTRLERGEIYLPHVHMLFGALVYPIGLIGWLFNWWANRTINLKLHRTFIGPILLRLCWHIFATFQTIQISETGYPSSIMLALRGIILFASICTTYGLLLYLSKGWGISRSKLSPHETRALAGLLCFVGVADLFYELEAGAALLGAIVFESITFIYMLWVLDSHRNSVGRYIVRIFLDQGERGLIDVWTSKLKMLCRVWRSLLFYAIAKGVLRITNFFLLIPRATYLAVLLDETVLALLFCYLGILLRLRSQGAPLYLPAQIVDTTHPSEEGSWINWAPVWEYGRVGDEIFAPVSLQESEGQVAVGRIPEEMEEFRRRNTSTRGNFLKNMWRLICST